MNNHAGYVYDAVVLYAMVADSMMKQGLDPTDGRLFTEHAQTIVFQGNYYPKSLNSIVNGESFNILFECLISVDRQTRFIRNDRLTRGYRSETCIVLVNNQLLQGKVRVIWRLRYFNVYLRGCEEGVLPWGVDAFLPAHVNVVLPDFPDNK